jgi:hypothetical protein
VNNLLDSPGIEVRDAVLSFSRLYSGENSMSLCEAVGEGRFDGDLCSAGWMYARSSYSGEVGNGDDASLLPSVVVVRPIFTKERKAMLTLCLPLSDVAILHDIDWSLQWFLEI